MFQQEDTIAAIATPVGVGGISVIRVSGPSAIEVVDKSYRGRCPISAAMTQTAHFGTYTNPHGEVIDEVVVTVFKNPKSYTGEDVVEVSCHGGIIVTKLILEQIIDHGARLAMPGEFTKRAFLNGKIDLVQAEAVADLIHARSEVSRETSTRQLQGRLSGEITNLRQRLIDLASLIELELDFSEEGIEIVDSDEKLRRIEEVETGISTMVNTYSAGKISKDGVRVVLAGKPNAGKSSIFNRLLRTNRAIVTDSPGTTRDTLEESIEIEGISYIIVDTAGLREGGEGAEIEGVERSLMEITKADIVLFILDLHSFDFSEDKLVFDSLSEAGKPTITVGNKSDILGRDSVEIHEFERFEGNRVVISARNGYGFEELKSMMKSLLEKELSQIAERRTVVSNLRHLSCLGNSLSYIRYAKESLMKNASGEVIALDIKKACRSLDEIVGAVTTEDILGNIFSKFCIGK